MPRRRSATLQFNAIRLVGGFLPAALIEQIARQEAPGQKASDYGLPKTLRIQVAVDQAWSRARALWQEAMELSGRGEGTPWRVWFSSRLLREVFGWEDLASCTPRRIEEALYPISHQAFGGKVPVVLTSVETGLLDQGSKAYGQDGRRRSPHSCLQECLNADDSSEWGVLCNGTTLRLLHDNPALVKPAYVQVELGAIFDGGLFDEFAGTGRPLSWPLQEATSGIAQVFPSMRTDIVIDRRDRPQRLVIDTKFASVFTRGWYRDQTIRAGTIYQLYAYLRSQEDRDDPAAAWADSAAGLLLHPAIDTEVDESVQIQGHRLRFATVDLTASHTDLRARLLQLASPE